MLASKVLLNCAFAPASLFNSVCSETTLTGESQVSHEYPPGDLNPGPLWWEANRKSTGPVRHGENEVRLQALHRTPPQQRRLWSWKGDLQRAWNGDRRAVWDQVRLSHCRHEGQVMIQDEVRLRRGHRNDQSRRGHQCSEMTLIGQSWCHISTPQWIWTRVPCDRKQTGRPLDQWDIMRMQWDCRLSTSTSNPELQQNNRRSSWLVIQHTVVHVKSTLHIL
jgi:hypothetical protein